VVYHNHIARNKSQENLGWPETDRLPVEDEIWGQHGRKGEPGNDGVPGSAGPRNLKGEPSNYLASVTCGLKVYLTAGSYYTCYYLDDTLNNFLQYGWWKYNPFSHLGGAKLLPLWCMV